MASPHGPDVAVRYGAVEGSAVSIVPLNEFQAPSVEVAQPPVPKLGVGHRVHRQLGGAIDLRSGKAQTNTSSLALHVAAR